MEVYTKILGNLRSPEWRERLSNAEVDYIELDQWNAQKSRLLAIGVSGRAYALALGRGTRLADGDIIAYDPNSHTASVVRLKLGDVLVIDLSPLKRKTTEEMLTLAIELGHAIGNQHWAALTRGEALYIPLTVDRKVMLSVLHTYNFDSISYSFRPGGEIVPYLSPSEIRTLFGSGAPASHPAHSHASHSHHSMPLIDDYV